jgi:microcystin-dependent protein
VPHLLRQAVIAAPLLFVSVGATALADVPTQFAIQGSLRDNMGKLQSMAVPAAVSLFDASVGGTRIAGPYAFASVQVQNGLFTLAIDDSAIAGKLGKGTVFVELTVAGEVYSRFQVASQFFALRAGQCDSAEQLRAFPLSATAPMEGQLLRFTAGAWTPTTVAGGGGQAGPPGPPGPAGEIPAGAVLAFDLERCPPGWAPFGPAAGRTVVGVNAGGNGLSVRAVGALFGAENHALTADELPPHTHAGSTGSGKAMRYRTVGALGTASAANHVAGWAGTDIFVDREDAGYALAQHTHDFVTNGGAVGGKAHNNLQPSVALLYCRKQ